jgi:hypothetical protein
MNQKDRIPRFPQRDIRFLVETLFPQRTDPAELAANVRTDDDAVESMLNDPRLFDRVMGEEAILLQVTPKLFFSVLLRQARKDLRLAKYTVEWRSRQKIPVFDSDRVAELLDDRELAYYLADMLTSFTRIESVTWRVRVREGLWRKHHVSDLDIDGLIRLCDRVDEFYRFGLYRRIADVCLFLTGMFPEYVEQRGFSPAELRRGRKRDLEGYEEEGRRFYGLAAEHEVAEIMGMSGVLQALQRDFALAEKPLRFLSQHYLHARKHTLFGL